MKRTTVYLAPELHERLTAAAEREESTLADLVRQGLDRLLGELERMRAEGRGVAEPATAYRTRHAAPADVRRTTMYLPDDTRRRLADAAALHGKSQAELIREAVEEFLDNLERPWPQFIGIAEDHELSGRDAREWIRRTWIDHI